MYPPTMYGTQPLMYPPVPMGYPPQSLPPGSITNPINRSIAPMIQGYPPVTT